MHTKALRTVLVSALLVFPWMLFSGCGNGDDNNGATATAGKNRDSGDPDDPRETPGVSNNQGQRDPTQAIEGDEPVGRIEDHLESGFEDSEWYAALGDVDVSGNTATARMTRSGTELGDENLKQICNAVAGFVFSEQQFELDISRVVVVDSEGQIVNEADRASRECLSPGDPGRSETPDAEVDPE